MKPEMERIRYGITPVAMVYIGFAIWLGFAWLGHWLLRWLID
jgi:hypothetical protein